MIAFTLPAWLERLMGVSPADAGEGTQWELRHAWPLPSWATLLLVVATVAVIAYFYFRERQVASRWYVGTMAVLRMLVFGLVYCMITEAVLVPSRTGLPYVAIILDTSKSMRTLDSYSDEDLLQRLGRRVQAVSLSDPTRIGLAKSLLLEDDGELFHALLKRYKVKLYFADATARTQVYAAADSSAAGDGPAENRSANRQRDATGLIGLVRDARADGASSRLGGAVRTVLSDLRGTPPSAIILLSDGINTEGEPLGEAATYAQRKGVPLFTIALGSEDPIRNLELSELAVDEAVFVDDVVPFEFRLTGAGYGGRRVKVSLREKDKPQVLAEMGVTIDRDGRPQKVRLPYRPREEGEFQYVVEVEQLEDEHIQDDNRLETSHLVRVVNAQIKVLFVQSYPNYDYRYLKAMFERDKTVDLDVVLQEADLDYAEIDLSALRVFPVRRDELDQYDVLIFGDVDPSFLSSTVMNNIAEFVSVKGRGIVFMAGPRYTPLEYRHTPLAALFPLDLGTAAVPDPEADLEDGFKVQLTPIGAVSPQMQLGDTQQQTEQLWRGLPPLYWLLEANNLLPAARVLAEHPSRVNAAGRRLPVVIEQYVGAGKVIFHATDETSRWRVRSEDVLFRRYWVQTLRYLSRSKLLGRDRAAELTVGRQRYNRGEAIRFRVRFRDESRAPTDDDGVTVMVERRGHKSHQVKLRRSPTSRGIFEGVLNNAAEGQYHAWIATPAPEGKAPAKDFEVVALPGEEARLQMDVAELKLAATTSGGHYYAVAASPGYDRNQLLRDLPPGRQVVIETMEPFVLWNNPYPLPILVIGLLVVEWIMRKRKGLL